MKLTLTLLTALLLAPLATLRSAARQGKPLPQALSAATKNRLQAMQEDFLKLKFGMFQITTNASPWLLKPWRSEAPRYHAPNLPSSQDWVLVLERVKQK